MTEVQDRNGRQAAVFLGHHTGTSVPAQAHRANPHTRPSPAPPSMEKARAPSSHSLSGNKRSVQTHNFKPQSSCIALITTLIFLHMTSLYCPALSVRAFLLLFKKKKVIPIYILKKPSSCQDRLKQMSSGKPWCSCCKRDCSPLSILLPRSQGCPHSARLAAAAACPGADRAMLSGHKLEGLRRRDTSFC